MNGLHFFFGVGAFLSPILVAQAILRTGDITWGFWGLALLILPLFVWVLRLPAPRAAYHDRSPERTPAGARGAGGAGGPVLLPVRRGRG